MRKYCFAVVLPLLFPFPSVLAFELDPIIVTATRTARTADETLAPVTVITREDIETQQAQSLQDIFRTVAGMTISNNGGPGKTTSVFLRGTESDHVLVLIDGIKVGSATLGTTPYQHIPIDQIERIEIVRGPRSSLYGSEAIGGVIQIFTRKGGGELRPSFSAGYGRYRTYDTSVGLSGGGERGWFNLHANSIDTDGFNAKDTGDEPDDDGYRNLSGSLRAGYRFDNGFTVDMHLLRAKNDTEFDGDSPNESESDQQVLGGTVRYSPTSNWDLTLTAGQSRDESDNFKDGVFTSSFDTERDTLSFQNDIAMGDNHLLTLGGDYRDDEVSGTTDYAVDSREDKGIFGQYQGIFSNHDLQLSLRWDDNDQFGNHTTGNATWGYAPTDNLRFIASYGAAFKAPTFNELYYPNFGNPSLDPEESRSFELGMKGNARWGDWSLNAYRTDIDDLIAYDARAERPDNISEARIYGLEGILATHIEGWNLNANFHLLDPENRSGGEKDGNRLNRRTQRSVRLDMDRAFGKLAIGMSVFAEGDRYDDLANTEKLGGYTLVDLRAEYRFRQDWRLQARIDNLLDKKYETAESYNQPRCGLFVTLHYQP
uniref:Vitamin B12 transporter n=1 Tax=Candidatus Kentrum sp. FM TaxID=2126340 RepID=A0A450WK25_9GAMM|nr:MAG: vitamin B12 transporter [Candidatus Kentron sp. FM]VFJ71634.1 MAG: vitamin B12 transporter [Candidatus Kentron sp. FM]VFK17381.1 MAG: vitamin B12 transporter [Candidatus Kentron sp. FM]